MTRGRRKSALTAYFEPEDYEKIQRLARERQQSISEYVVEIILKAIGAKDQPKTVDERLAALERSVKRLEDHVFHS